MCRSKDLRYKLRGAERWMWGGRAVDVHVAQDFSPALPRGSLTIEGLRTAQRRRGRLGRCHYRLGLCLERPSAGSAAAMHTAKEDGSGFAPHAVVVTSGEIAAKPVPHGVLDLFG